MIFKGNISCYILLLEYPQTLENTATVQLSEELEISQRSIQRYIAALTAAGEWIEYDKILRGMNPCAVSLVDKQNRMEFVKSAVKNFEEHILKHLKNL